MHKFTFGWVSAPDPAGGAYSPRDSFVPLVVFKGPTSKGKGVKWIGGKGKVNRKGERKVKKRGGRGGGGRDFAHPEIFGMASHMICRVFSGSNHA